MDVFGLVWLILCCARAHDSGDHRVNCLIETRLGGVVLPGSNLVCLVDKMSYP